MRKLFLQINTSLDEFIEDSTGEIDWHFVDDEFEQFINDTLRSIEAMVFGRVAYEKLADYWPTAASNPEASQRHMEAAQLMNELPKNVVSNSLDRAESQNSRIVRGDVAEEIRALKERADKDIALFAGAGVASSFARLGLIDEYRIIVNPIMLGAGTRLFAGGQDTTRLRLVETRRFDSGALVLSCCLRRVGRTRLGSNEARSSGSGWPASPWRTAAEIPRVRHSRRSTSSPRGQTATPSTSTSTSSTSPTRRSPSTPRATPA